jgi:hypothetical protein
VTDYDRGDLLTRIAPGGRDVLRRLMRADQFERDEFSSALAAHLDPEILPVATSASMQGGTDIEFERRVRRAVPSHRFGRGLGSGSGRGRHLDSDTTWIQRSFFSLTPQRGRAR